MTFTGLSIGVTRKGKYKVFCLISQDGTVHGRLNQLRAISFKDQPRVGYVTMEEALDYAQKLNPDQLTDYVENDKLPSRGVHVDQEEYEGKYIHALLQWEDEGGSWVIPRDPQLEFDFVRKL
jgi:hypothetical protein